MPTKLQGLAPLLQVFDVQASVNFYTQILGFRVISSADFDGELVWVLLEYDGIQLMLNAKFEPSHRPTTRPAPINHDVTLYFGTSDADALYQELLAKHTPNAGWSLIPPTTAPYGMRQLHVRDPDNFQLCFQHPTAGS